MKEIIDSWILSSDHLPEPDSNVEISNDGIKSDGTADFKRDRTCMMAGYAAGNGYFSSLGFATDGSNGEDRNLILDTPKYWRYC